MKREIKFRIWDVENKYFWTEKDKLNVAMTVDGLPLFWTGDETRIVQKFWPEELWVRQQFTGVKDKYGKEIYEGDIILFGDLNYEVFWNKHKWEATCPSYAKYNWPKLEDFGRDAACSKVVGNIFENKDLLK